MRKPFLLLLIGLFIMSSVIFAHTREFMMQVVNSSSNPIQKTVKLYKLNNTSTPHRTGSSWSASASQAAYGRNWRWTSPNCNLASDIGDNNTNPTSWASISTGTYYLRIDNRYVTLNLYSPGGGGSIDCVIKYKNSNFSKVSGPLSVNISSTNNWPPPPPPLNASIVGSSTIYLPTKIQYSRTYSWSANVSGGVTPYSYQWYYKLGSLAYQYVGSGSSYSRTYTYIGYKTRTDNLKLVVTDNANQTKTVYKTISIRPPANQKISVSGNQAAMEVIPEYLSVGNFPNPFNPITNINYSLPELSIVNVDVYDLNGQKVITWNLGEQSSGNHSIMWNGTNQNGNEVPAGIYLYHFYGSTNSTNKAFSKKGKMIFMK